MADKSYNRAHDLRSKKVSSQAVLDRAEAQRNSARAGLQSARKLLVLTNGTRKEELDQA